MERQSVRFKGVAPLDATVYELEKLRCNLCGEIFTAEMPDKPENKKYDASSKAMIVLLKYGSGIPFYRLEKLQASYQLSVLEVILKFEDLEIWKRSSRLCADLYKHF